MLDLKWTYHEAKFVRPGKTSRGTLTTKPSWIIQLSKTKKGNTQFGYGEVSIIPGLSLEKEEEIVEVLQWVKNFLFLPHKRLLQLLDPFPAVRFAFEMALKDLKTGGKQKLFNTDFTNSEGKILTNGLVWMNDYDQMLKEARVKLNQGFKCLKFKVGAISFDKELELISKVRNNYATTRLQIRVDANGAFSAENAPYFLEKLSKLKIHSIEQPIKQGQWKAMANLCATSPIPIALDEELIGVHRLEEKERLLDTIKPQYIILKPSLLGGWEKCEEWIKLAKKRDIGFWVTSALELNLGLNAIAQWTSTLKVKMSQGLGTGQVFENNIASPLYLNGSNLRMKKNAKWDLPRIV